MTWLPFCVLPSGAAVSCIALVSRNYATRTPLSNLQKQSEYSPPDVCAHGRIARPCRSCVRVGRPSSTCIRIGRRCCSSVRVGRPCSTCVRVGRRCCSCVRVARPCSSLPVSRQDLHRTGCTGFSGQENEEDRAVLKRVLLAFARWNKQVGRWHSLTTLCLTYILHHRRQIT